MLLSVKWLANELYWAIVKNGILFIEGPQQFENETGILIKNPEDSELLGKACLFLKEKGFLSGTCEATFTPADDSLRGEYAGEVVPQKRGLISIEMQCVTDIGLHFKESVPYEEWGIPPWERTDLTQRMRRGNFSQRFLLQLQEILEREEVGGPATNVREALTDAVILDLEEILDAAPDDEKEAQ